MYLGGKTEPNHGEWTLVTGEALRRDLAGVWRSESRRLNGSAPALDWRFISLLHEFFQSGSEVLAVSDRCMALMQPCGWGRWQTFLPSQACVGSLILAPGQDAESIRGLMASLGNSLPGATVLLSLRKQDAAIAQLCDAHAGNRFAKTVFGITTTVDTRASFDSFWQSRSKNLRQSVRRRLRSVEKSGATCHMRIIREAEHMPGAIETHSFLESSGWKGRLGTALDGADQQSRFYLQLMTRFATEGDAAAYQLLFDEDVKASLLTIQSAGTLIPLKTAYDESSARFAPGRLLDFLFLQQVFGDPSISKIENYTDSTEEDRRWCTSNRNITDWDYYPLDIIRFAIQTRRRILSRIQRS